jgi:hypothetical protein
MAQFSWTKAGVYGFITLLLAAIVQATVILPGMKRWVAEEKNKKSALA